eukprot:TRINITY_DN8904_c0_g2_i3.p1 TRINITY_DN8904_c0_g2~~TRINITY_DN8904_c0_g2_i3.p1  ORF type:complete len:302 (-),score=82.82 TRINITY_DN8904_c0_g2_i3:9-914(-)
MPGVLREGVLLGGTNLSWWQGFFATMVREWGGIDRLRLDKFYMLVETFVVQCFELLAGTEWDEEVVEQFATDLQATVLAPNDNSAKGLTMFLIKKWLGKLSASGEEIPVDAVGKFVDPFFAILSKAADKHIVTLTSTHIFEGLLPTKMDQNQTPIVANIPEMMEELFSMASSRETRDSNRKVIYSLHRQYETCIKVLQQMEEEEGNDDENDDDHDEENVEVPEVEEDDDEEDFAQLAEDAGLDDLEEEEEEEEEEVVIQPKKKKSRVPAATTPKIAAKRKMKNRDSEARSTSKKKSRKARA